MTIGLFGVGQRVELVKKFQEEFDVIAYDQNEYAPALVEAEYGTTNEDDLDGIPVINLTDYYVAHKNLVGSNYAITEACADKTKYKKYFGVKTPKSTVHKFRFGSGSVGMKIKQKKLEGTEYNIQAYYDLKTEKLVGFFAQEKLEMKYGETFKSKSVFWHELYKIAEQLEGKGLKGPVDIDCIDSYVIDINPRFGGGYPLAHELGINFIKLLKRNLQGEEIKVFKHEYKTDIVMAKYPATVII